MPYSTSSDSKIFNDPERRAASLRQLSFLLILEVVLCCLQRTGKSFVTSGSFSNPSQFFGCSGVVVEYRVRLTPGPLQATSSKLLTYSVLRPTQPPTLSGTGNEL